MNTLSRSYRALRSIISNISRPLWRRLPITVNAKQRIKHGLFSKFPFLFRRLATYRNWQNFIASQDWRNYIESTNNATLMLPHDLSSGSDNTGIYVPLLKAHPPVNLPVRLIAFYLPQFHPIPENNKWWGEGFTEWGNVKPAQAQFEGHYQPHVPGELGYYNLLDSEVQRRQVYLAKLYGVGGFCFYTYWFGGKLLLEKPVENYLNDRSLSLPFCLCWANENWTRRWDGLDNEILIGQKHSPEDDLAFIQHISQFMRDERYIRIDGKPLLLVYRPSLLPSVKDLAQRWRSWCQQAGIGDIYLAYTQSFEMVDPNEYGFDAAIEFPPNSTAPPVVTKRVKPLNSDFGCTVYDWRIFVQRSRNYLKPSYKLFRGVCPSWDNTARRKNKATILLHSTPLGYQEWLKNAVDETCGRITNPDERLIFVNAWNEWAEGAHLEPDQHYGYAYLEATRMALLRSSNEPFDRKNQAQNLAVVVHAYYMDVFEEILGYLDGIDIPFKLFVTTPLEQEKAVEALISKYGFNYYLLGLSNHGRDVLPFLKVVPKVEEEGYKLLLKLHTKKSPHRQDGQVWRNDIYEKLMDSENMRRIIQSLRDNKNIGIVGPEGHVVSMSTYWGKNESTIIKLAGRMGVSREQVVSQAFVAGTMFFARLSALQPLMNLAIADSDFEPEAGQVDGTLAHAIERAFVVSMIAANQQLMTSKSLGDKFGVTVVNEYKFAPLLKK